MPDAQLADVAAQDASSGADRSARRSVHIGVRTLVGGVLAIFAFVVAKKAGHHNGLMPLLVFPAMLIGHTWGTMEAIHAFRKHTTLRRQASIGLKLNGALMAIILGIVALVLLFAAGTGDLGR